MTRPPALILTAGLGTRLRPLTYACAKAAVPVNGQPLCHRIAAWLASHRITDQVFNLHHHPQTIAAALGDGGELGVRIRYSWEQEILGSAGGPRHALPLLADAGTDDFLIVNGDTLTNLDLEALLLAHRDSGADVTMALIPNPSPDKYGGVAVDADGFVTGFTRRGSARESLHFIGVQVAARRTFEALPDNMRDSSVGRLYPELIAASPRAIHAFVSSAGFRDIGTPTDYLHTCLDLAADEGDRLVSRRAVVAPDATLSQTVVWDDVTIGAGAELTGCIVGGGVAIPAGASFANCAIVSASGIRPTDGERIEGSILVTPLPADQPGE